MTQKQAAHALAIFPHSTKAAALRVHPRAAVPHADALRTARVAVMVSLSR